MDKLLIGHHNFPKRQESYQRRNRNKTLQSFNLLMKRYSYNIFYLRCNYKHSNSVRKLIFWEKKPLVLKNLLDPEHSWSSTGLCFFRFRKANSS